MIHALEQDGKSNFTFEGERLGFGKYGIGPEAEWDCWTQVVIYRNVTDATYVVQIGRLTPPSTGRGTRRVVVYQTAEHLLADLQCEETDAKLLQATLRALAAAVSKDPSLRDLLSETLVPAFPSQDQPAAAA